ncbi:MAG: methyltransferase domain-containing protein [Lacibacter sp.]
MRIEDRHFWFQSRNYCIKCLMRRFEQPGVSKTFLEIGCDTGVMPKHLSSSSAIKLSGAEIHLAGLQHARKRLPDVEFLQLDALKMPFHAAYDAVGMFDVLEHIDENVTAIRNVHKILVPRGLFFISVPQYAWMWSSTDDEAFHKRRYSRKESKEKLYQSGFRVLYYGSFMFTLFPFMYVSRILTKRREGNGTELEMNPFINYVFRFLSRLDILLINAGFQLPFGGSIMCVAQKVS